VSPAGARCALCPDRVRRFVATTASRELYTALRSALAPLGLAYVHLAASGDERLLLTLRAVRPSAMIVDPTGSPDGPWTDRAAAERSLALGADLVSLGRA
jgi:N-ethylmaleimide reductase